MEKDAIEVEAQVWREMGGKSTRSSHNGNYEGKPYIMIERSSFIYGY